MKNLPGKSHRFGHGLISQSLIGQNLIGQNLIGQNLTRIQEEEAPFRSEIFSADQMERHGKILAAAHKISGLYHEDTLLKRLDENEVILARTVKLLTKAVQDGTRISPAGEWLLDNFYLIEEQIRATRRHFPKNYSIQLPRLENDATPGVPRVYDLALATISCGDGRVDLDSLNRFVEKYQTVSQLKLGELWAIPIMLRLALIENLRRVAVAIANGLANRDLASTWADKMVATAEKDPKSLILVLADMARSNPPMVGSFVSELARRLQWQSPGLAMPLTWIEQRLSEDGLTIEQLIQSETQTQASNQVSIANSIGSLRLLGAVDWSTFVEKQSHTEHALTLDPAGIYEKMNFATRDRYRHFVEKIARDLQMAEVDIARLAVQLALEAYRSASARKGSSGPLRILFDRQRPDSIDRTHRQAHAPKPQFCRINSILGCVSLSGVNSWLLPLALSDYSWTLLRLLPITPISRGLALAAAAVVCAQLAFEIVNWFATIIKIPSSLPRMDFEKRIAGKCPHNGGGAHHAD